MGLVVDDIVKLPWEEDLFFTTKKGMFLFACQRYTNAEGNSVDVFFVPQCCFVLVDTDEEPLDFDTVKKEYKSVAKDEGVLCLDDFPDDWEGAYYIMYPTEEPFDDMLEKFGLTEFKDDIKARCNDINGYSVEVEVDSI